jgi:hypothetical protein
VELEQLALALATKSATLKRLGRRHAMRPFDAIVSQYGSEAVDEFDEQATRLWSAEESQDRRRLAWVLLTQALVFEQCFAAQVAPPWPSDNLATAGRIDAHRASWLA